jgi:hypothetical protein
MLKTDENSTALSDATPMKRLRVFVSVSAIMVGCTVPAFARLPYDGYWSVVITTRRGDCEPSVRQPVQITNGIVINPANGMAQIEGRVSPNGAVRVTVRTGSQWAIGSGRLGLSRGGGMWHGQGNAGFCEGTWAAERRTGDEAGGKDRPGPI